MSIDVNVQNDLVVVTESSEDIVVNVSNAAGPQGPAGTNGVGVPVGGSTGQVLKKLSATNYDTYWALDGGGVPYSGATGDVHLGEYELKAGQVEFDQTPTGTAGVGVMRWNNTDGTLDLGLKGGNVTLQVGQEQVLRVVNKTGADLLESQYKAVRIRLVSEGGAQGQRLAVVLAQGNNDPDSTTTIGIVTENIANNQEGFITTSGEVRGINTTGSLQGETWADGDIIYLSPTVPGGITIVKPIAPNHMVVLGYVIYSHAINGKIFTKVDSGYELGELHDVYVPTPSNNDGIFWNTANSRYQNNSISGVLGYTPVPTTRTLTINGTAYDLSADRSWTVSSAANTIYTADGTLAGDRTVTSGGNSLTILGGKETFTGYQRSLWLKTSTNDKSSVELILENTFTTTGKLYEIGSYSDGSFNITDRTTSNLRFKIKDRYAQFISNDAANSMTIGEAAGINAIWFNQTGLTATTANYTICNAGGLTLLNAPTGGHIRFRIANADKMMLSNAGRLLLGTTTESTYLLDVNGTARVSGMLTIAGGTTSSISSPDNRYLFGGSGSGTDAIKIGQLGNANGNYSIAMQNGATASGLRSMAFGTYATASGYDCIAMGGYSIAGNNEFQAGGYYSITNVYFGSGSSRGNVTDGVGVAYTINGSGALGTNFAGGNVTIAGGKGTGSGTSGDVIISTATTTTSGTTLQSLTERVRVYGTTGNVEFKGVILETITTNRQTASYTLALTDRGKLVEMNVATANNLTVPLNSSIAFPIGTKIDIAQYGAGQTTVVATGGVTIRSAGGALKLAAQYSGASLVKIGTDEWYLFGDITV